MSTQPGPWAWSEESWGQLRRESWKLNCCSKGPWIWKLAVLIYQDFFAIAHLVKGCSVEMCAGVLYVLWYSYPHMLVQCSSRPWKARGVNHVLNANAMDVQVRTTGSLSRRGNQSYRWCLQCWNLEAEAIDLICTRKKKGIPWDTIQIHSAYSTLEVSSSSAFSPSTLDVLWR